ncbi:hypothetical protein SAMN05421640_1914 [Ekhidna lutea]|uniref:Uncharacterized protein n=1 Tax=Ekhidna lutea TaxID=447679 RepID=A0A239J2Y3_EKHLU|nr:hypothetical protein [Ekhidna lutea]SNS99024.1 hypothetical protein SAMN05421640_1914 [Ekhidna lutea]
MDLKDHDNNLRIIGKIFIVIGLILVPISISTFFFVDMISHSDFWHEIRHFEVMFMEIHPPQNLLYMLPILQTLSLLVFIVSGYGLATKQDWGKKFAIVPAVLLLFKFPIGTALGGYMIYAIHYVPKEEVSNGNEPA